jgi:NADH-quinone oxidoreductase subunit J
MSAFFFYLFAILAIGSAAYAVLLTRNVVRAAFALIGAFGGIAGLFGVMGADYLVAAQLVVYVGGILVLLLFGVMMSRRATLAELPGSSPGIMGWLGVAGIVGALAFVGAQVIATTDWNVASDLTRASVTRDLGSLLLTKYLLPFEFISVLLLGALIGAVMLTRKEVR